MKNITYNWVNRLFGNFEFETKKYFIFINAEWNYIYKKRKFIGITTGQIVIKKQNVYKVSILKKDFFKYLWKERKYIEIDPKIFFNKIPDLEDMLEFTDYFSDQKMDNQIDRLIKLQAFI